jgi:3-isopropylmalate/(R)-2-methylmalate dehydratase small subunit
MEPISIIVSHCVPLEAEHVDTDQIIPARFLKATTREGFGDNLFRDWRYHSDGSPKESFVLNQPGVKGRILIAGKNFGCGSSREHAAWALYDHGFRVVISSFFADIFKNNALNNGLLPIQLDEVFVQQLFTLRKQDPELELQVDLPNQTVTVVSTQEQVKFDINDHKKSCLLQGFDDIDYLINQKDQVLAFEQERKTI